jgi:hypothetical protein
MHCKGRLLGRGGAGGAHAHGPLRPFCARSPPEPEPDSPTPPSLSLPQPVADALNAQIELDIAVMQAVIVYGRAIRDRHQLNMKTPLPEVTLVHKDPAKLEAVKRTEKYIIEELNVRSVKTALVSDVPELVRLKCLPNHQLLGKRFGKDYKGVQEQIKALTHAQLADFLNTGKMTVGAHDFATEDILMLLEYTGDQSTSVEFEDEDKGKGGLVLLNTRPTQADLDEAMAREVCAKIQKMRKDAQLQKSDQVDVGFTCAAEGSVLARVLVEKASYIAGRIGRPIVPMSALPALAVPLSCESHQVKVQHVTAEGSVDSATEKTTISICRSCAFFDEAKLAASVPDATLRDGAQFFVHAKDVEVLKAQLGGSGNVLRFNLDGKDVSLKRGEHFFLGSVEAAKAGLFGKEYAALSA